MMINDSCAFVYESPIEIASFCQYTLHVFVPKISPLLKTADDDETQVLEAALAVHQNEYTHVLFLCLVGREGNRIEQTIGCHVEVSYFNMTTNCLLNSIAFSSD